MVTCTKLFGVDFMCSFYSLFDSFVAHFYLLIVFIFKFFDSPLLSPPSFHHHFSGNNGLQAS